MAASHLRWRYFPRLDAMTARPPDRLNSPAPSRPPRLLSYHHLNPPSRLESALPQVLIALSLKSSRINTCEKPRGRVPQTGSPRYTLLTRTRQLDSPRMSASKPFGIKSFGDLTHLSPMQSHLYQKQGEGLARPVPSIRRHFFSLFLQRFCADETMRLAYYLSSLIQSHRFDPEPQ